MHGWDGNPQEGWFLWLKSELKKRNFEVIIPQFPDAESPRIQKWVPKLAEIVNVADEKTFFVGHSMGCQAIARYLEQLPENVSVGGAVFVAGFFKRLTNLENEPDVIETEKHWLGAPIDLGKVQKHLPKSIAIFSDDDPWVPLDNQNDFSDKLGSEIIIKHNKGYFSGSRDKTLQIPLVLEKLLKLASLK